MQGGCIADIGSCGTGFDSASGSVQTKKFRTKGLELSPIPYFHFFFVMLAEYLILRIRKREKVHDKNIELTSAMEEGRARLLKVLDRQECRLNRKYGMARFSISE